MNFMSKYHSDKEVSINEQHHDCDNNCHHPIPGNSLLRCNYGSLNPLNVAFTARTSTQTFNIPIANVTIDTTCLHRPNLLIKFTGILTVTPISAPASSKLVFTLFELCKGSRLRQALTTFNFFVSNAAVGPSDSRTLDFEFSSCDDQCKDCCTYILELTSISNADLGGSINYSINGKICALAVGSPC